MYHKHINIPNMKKSSLIIQIPEPCQEDWNKMQPDVKGKFCNSCNKSVFDFTSKSDNEIQAILLQYKDQKVCGHFKKTQINRPLNISFNLRDLPKNISITKVFAIAIFLVFGTFLFSCTNEQGQNVNKIEVIETENQTLGLMSNDFSPPIIDSVELSFETLSGDTVLTLDSLETILFSESHVSGGLSFEEIQNEEGVVIDTINLDEITVSDEMFPLIDSDMISGSVTAGAVYVNEQCSFISNDSINKSKLQQENNKDNIYSKKALTIFPNPNNGEFTINYNVLKRAKVNVSIYDMNGNLITTVVEINNQHNGKYQIPVNLSGLSNGIYLVSLIIDEKKTTEILVIER